MILALGENNERRLSMSHKNYKDLETDELVEVVEPDKGEETNTIIGQVHGCTKLNIRKEPNKAAEIVAVVDRDDFLAIDFEQSNDEWYAVCTVAGISGYCMAAFVVV